MDAVTKEAGVSKQTVYSYYASKDDLLIDVLKKLIHSLTESLVSLEHFTFNNQNELQQVLRHLAHQYIRSLMQSNYLALMRVIISESPRFPQLGELFRSTLPNTAYTSVSAVLQQAKNKGLVHSVDTDAAVRMFVGPLLTYILLGGVIVTDRPFQQPEMDELDAIVDLYMKAIVKDH
jgi:TetR/AcrR family transcriptional repressor of mexJK operon